MESSSATHGCRKSAHVSRYGKPALAENDAWDIAMAWRDQLRGCVRLELASEELSSSIIPAFEWVTFVFHGDLHRGHRAVEDAPKTAAYARAATVAWFALSCCEGYSGAENPQFWKRVFYELLYPEDLPSVEERRYWTPYPTHLPITDAFRFFDHPDRPFPRIRLSLNGRVGEETIAYVLLGRQSYEDQDGDTKLLDILAKLEPIMRKSDARRSVPVQLDMWCFMMEEHYQILRNVPSEVDLKSRVAVSAATMVEFPQLCIRSLKVSDKDMHEIHHVHSLMPPSDVEAVLGGDLSSLVQDRKLWRGFLNELEEHTSVESHRNWRVTRIDVVSSDDVSYSDLSSLCSALPHLHSVHSVKMPIRRYVDVTPVPMTSIDWAWLGYAIFHPDAASTSGLQSLEFDLDRSISIDAAALANMALGNNLLGGTNAGYLEGLIRSGTEATVEGVQDDASTLYTFAAASWAALIVSSPEALDNQELVCVVIPGYSWGLIHRDNIIETRTREAGASCIRSLSVENYTEEPVDDATDETLQGLLCVLGSRLTSLRFKKSNHVSASRVRAILSLCPSLRSLRIHHDGSFWADETLAMEVPRLEELELTVHGRYSPVRWSNAYRRDRAIYDRYGGPPLAHDWETRPVQPLQELKTSCLPHLKALHVISARDGAYKQHESILVSFLSQQPVVQYFNWSRGDDPSRQWVDILADSVKEATSKFQARLPEEHHFSLGPLCVKCRVAFLSVIQDMEAQSYSVGRLGKDVIALIFAYATSPSPREISINPYFEEKPPY